MGTAEERETTPNHEEHRKVNFVGDQWNVHSQLGVSELGDQVARIALRSQTPFCVRVTGKWGSGKSSVLRRAYVALGGKPIEQQIPFVGSRNEDSENWAEISCLKSIDRLKKILGIRKKELRADEIEALQAIVKTNLCVWYSPWQHQKEENPLAPLLQEIVEQFQISLPSVKEAEKDALRRNVILGGLSIMERAIDATASFFSGKVIAPTKGLTKEIADSTQKHQEKALQKSDGQRFHLLFEEAIVTILNALAYDNGSYKISQKGSSLNPSFVRELIPAGETRLIFFIDDLDRCEEGVVVQLLETIKLYLNSRRCVFIFGMDDGAVIKAMGRYWQGRSPENCHEYLEKLFQATLQVPLPKKDNVEQYVEAQLEANDFPDPKKHAKVVLSLLEPNPRKIKNFINSLCASWGVILDYHPEIMDLSMQTMVNPTDKDFAEKFILITYLKLFHRPIWMLLEREPTSLWVMRSVLTKSPLSDAYYEDQKAKSQESSKASTQDGNKNPKRKDLDPLSQRIMAELISRAFSHVLSDDHSAQNETAHRRIPLGEAVTMLEERLDRKRSDTYFVEKFTQLTKLDAEIDPRFLYL